MISASFFKKKKKEQTTDWEVLKTTKISSR